MHVIYKGNADLNFEVSLEQPSTKEKQKCRAPMVLQEGLESLLRESNHFSRDSKRILVLNKRLCERIMARKKMLKITQ